MAKQNDMGIENGFTYDFDVIRLGKASCNKCGERLWWEAEFDADGTDYHAHCCGYHYTLIPALVEAIVEKDDI